MGGPAVPFNQLVSEANLVVRLHGEGMSLQAIGEQRGRSLSWAYRRWHWALDMDKAHGGFWIRANRLPMRGARNWDQAAFDAAVAAHQKVAATIKDRETLTELDLRLDPWRKRPEERMPREQWNRRRKRRAESEHQAEELLR